METSILISGFGGQGIMLMGQLLGFAANAASQQVTYYPSYGPEQRGGTANCTVVISDKPVVSPTPEMVDVLVAMNNPTIAKYLCRVRKGGCVIANSSQVSTPIERDDIKVYYVDSDKIAVDLGNAKASNMVVLGALLGATKAVDSEYLIATMKEKLAHKPEFFDSNKAAIEKGMDLVRSGL